MADNAQINKDAELIRKHLPEVDDENVQEDVDNSLFTERELTAYLLAERTDLTWEAAAEEMGISYGTYSGKMGDNVAEKKEKARATVRLMELIESDE